MEDITHPLVVRTHNQENMENVTHPILPPVKTLSSSLHDSEKAEFSLKPPPLKTRRRLSKQISLSGIGTRDAAWEMRRRQIRKKELKRKLDSECEENLTDEDMNELRGCIELGFSFNEEYHQELSNTIPALDLYFAVNRQLSPSPVSTPGSQDSSTGTIGRTSCDSDAWTICKSGEDPEQVKTKLKHWAQAVACSLMQTH